MVPRTGLEPARLAALAPETSASTIPPPGLSVLSISLLLRCKGTVFFLICQIFLPKLCVKLLRQVLPQVQLASAKLAICLKNSVFGFEKPSFFLGLRFSFFATFLMYRSVKSLRSDFLGMY